MKGCSLILFAQMSLVCISSYRFLLDYSLYFLLKLDYELYVSRVAGDPDAISKVFGREDINYLDGLTGRENLQLLNLM